MTISLFPLIALVATFSSALITTVDAHGYVNSPASRNYLCKEGQVQNCGEIQYEPQSLEAPKGLPFTRNGDSHLCSAGLKQFYELDKQGAKVWPTSKASDVHSFSWTFTAEHDTTDFKYYITKADWDASTTSGLTASDFESQPFLTVPMNGKAPPATMTHDLTKNMPSRSGYHVVYAVWTVDNTANAFYNCIDLDFGGESSNGSSSPSASSGSSANTSAATASGSGSGGSSTGAGSTSGASGYTAPTSSGNGSASSSGSSADHNNHAASAGCRMKRRRAPSGSLLAARSNYRRQ